MSKRTNRHNGRYTPRTKRGPAYGIDQPPAIATDDIGYEFPRDDLGRMLYLAGKLYRGAEGRAPLCEAQEMARIPAAMALAAFDAAHPVAAFDIDEMTEFCARVYDTVNLVGPDRVIGVTTVSHEEVAAETGGTLDEVRDGLDQLTEAGFVVTVEPGLQLLTTPISVG